MYNKLCGALQLDFCDRSIRVLGFGQFVSRRLVRHGLHMRHHLSDGPLHSNARRSALTSHAHRGEGRVVKQNLP